MEKCGCFDSGYILEILLGSQSGRALNVFIKNELNEIISCDYKDMFSEKDLVWMRNGIGLTVSDLEGITLPGYQSGSRGMADLTIQACGPKDIRKLLEELIPLLKSDVRYIRLIFQKNRPGMGDVQIHLIIRLIRSIILTVHSDMLLLPFLPGENMELESLWGNSYNEAHLIYQRDLQNIFMDCIKGGNADFLNQMVSKLRLPGMEVATFNYFSFKDINQTDIQIPALALILILSGVPGIDDLEAGNLNEITTLIQARQNFPIFHPSAAQITFPIHPSVFSLLRISPMFDQMGLFLINFIPEQIHFQIDWDSIGSDNVGWRDLLSDEPYQMINNQSLTLGKYQTLWLSHTI